MGDQQASEPNVQATTGEAPSYDERDTARARAEGLFRTASGALKKPAIGAGVVGAAVLAAGAIWGVTEAALAAAAAWAVYRMLRKRSEREAAAAAG